MSKFVNEIKEICKKNKKVDMYIDMDGTIAEYHLYNPEEISRKMEEEYLKNEPLKNVIDVLEEISKINNIEMYILSLSKTKKIELRQKDYDKSIMLDDEQVVLREAKKILNDKIEVFHISSALI